MKQQTPLTESNIKENVRLVITQNEGRIFRNNVGLFTTKSGKKTRTGLCVGSSDLIGWQSVIITPNMVGKTVAVFLAIETKTKKNKKKDNKQINFINQVNSAGGIAFIARSAEETKQKIKKWKQK